MQRLTKRLFFLPGLITMASFLLLSASSQAQRKPDLTVSAAASLKDALAVIDAQFKAATVHVNYGASGTLQRQIEQGAPVDVFISAAKKNMDDLEKAGEIVSGTRTDIASNRLVLIVPTGTPSSVHSFRDLPRTIVTHVAIGAPEAVPAGKYAQQVLTNLRIYDQVASKAVFCKDVREVLTQVELGNVEAGIVYRTDALTSKKVGIVATAPTSLHKPILYPIAVVKDSKNGKAAGDYVRYLSSPSTQATLKRFGFLAATSK